MDEQGQATEVPKSGLRQRVLRIFGLESRNRRVLVLIVGIIVLSVADLVVTLTHLRTIGMMEANPIARFLIETTQSSWALGAFKLASVAVCAGLLFKVRRHRIGELAAWCSLAILVGMCFTWSSYTKIIEDPVEMQLAQAGGCDQTWLMLP